MAAVSRWRSSQPGRLRLGLVVLEVVILASMIILAGLLELPLFVWLVLVGVSIVVQSVLLYNIGRVRGQLERYTQDR